MWMLDGDDSGGQQQNNGGDGKDNDSLKTH
jgi:hypothetical protein